MKRSKPKDDTTRQFEDALAAGGEGEHYLLRLFVTGSTPRSDPEMAKPDQIIVTPTLVKKLPLPFRKIIGDLSDKERVLVGLDLVPRGAPVKPPEDAHGV